MPCDTIYGFVGIVPETAERLNTIKKRSPERDYLQLILPDWLSRYTAAEIDPLLVSLCPGKLTFVVKNNAGTTTAVRFPEDPFLLSLLRILGKPLYSTSVNKSGEEILFKSADIIKTFGNEIDAFIDAGDLVGRKPSTILDITSEPYTIIRQGDCSIPSRYLME